MVKKTVFVFLNILVGALCSYSQSGTWSGELELPGLKMPIVFHLDDDNPSIDSPSQGVKGIPIQITREAPAGLSVSIPAIGATYQGVNLDNKIIGKFTQGGMTFPLTLVPGEMLISRPQTPKPPYPYSQEEVKFANRDAILKGTLTLPEGYRKETPVVIMITGSGLQNRDEEIFDHKPFAVIADALARNGIASLRYDDRGFGESSGDAVNCTTEDLMNDALAGIDLLRDRFNKVGVLGHSEGGTISFMLGADKKVDFIVSLAGMVVSGKETLLDQNRYLLSQAGYPQATVDEYCEFLALAFDGDKDMNKKLETSSLPIELKMNVQAGLEQLKTPYMQYFLTTDVRDRLGKVVCPVLALNGTKDSQVFHENNLGALNNGLPSNNSNKIMPMDGLNHLFQHCETGSSVEYATIEETISPDVLAIITQWINSL